MKIRDFVNAIFSLIGLIDIFTLIFNEHLFDEEMDSSVKVITWKIYFNEIGGIGMEKKENNVIVDVKIKNLNEYQKLLEQLEDIIEKLNNFDLEVEINQSLHKDWILY